MRYSVLSLGFEVLDNRPVLSIRVDGKNPFEQVAKEWRGFDPGEILGPGTPLVPDDIGHRVAVLRQRPLVGNTATPNARLLEERPETDPAKPPTT